MLTEIFVAGSQDAASRSASRDDLLGEASDHADLLRDGDENIGRDDPRQRMVPPGEHLESDDFARGEVHLRLEKGEKLAVLEAVADALFDLALGEQRALHSGVEPDRPGDSSAARTIHRNIGPPDKVGDADLGRWSRGDAGEAADLNDPLLE